jgi:uncharacterized membrane protein YbaN (DUF454 family)
MEEEKTRKQKLTTGEILWTAICSLIAFGGLFMVILGIVGDYLPVKASQNWILLGEASFQATMKMNYRWFGVIILLADALIAVIYLNYYAKKSDIDEERALRRQQRLQVISQSADASAPAAPTAPATEVKATPVKTKKN